MSGGAWMIQRARLYYLSAKVLALPRTTPRVLWGTVCGTKQSDAFLAGITDVNKTLFKAVANHKNNTIKCGTEKK